jgi:hypothetical protein
VGNVSSCGSGSIRFASSATSASNERSVPSVSNAISALTNGERVVAVPSKIVWSIPQAAT